MTNKQRDVLKHSNTEAKEAYIKMTDESFAAGRRAEREKENLSL